MVYLPTFTIYISQVLVNKTYMDDMGNNGTKYHLEEPVITSKSIGRWNMEAQTIQHQSDTYHMYVYIDIFIKCIYIYI